MSIPEPTSEETPAQPPAEEEAPARQDAVELVGDDQTEGGTAIHEPGRLMRIALMLREMQEEVRRAATDEAGRERLRTVHERAVEQLCGALSGDLREELNTLTLPFEDSTPTESEILIAQAQLIGWLEGLFQGIQAAIMNQQLQARQQLSDMRTRGLPPGIGPDAGPREHRGTGQYL
jgi:hypothetical protein